MKVTKLAVAGPELEHEDGVDASIEFAEGTDSVSEQDFVTEG